MPTIIIDGVSYTFDGEGRNLLDVCLSLGFNVPYFCWHPALHSVGACRQCAVKAYKDTNDTRGKLVMACMTPAIDGQRIAINDPDAVNFRARVIEWLMVNHPHDCPVCDEGGECHLQDMTVMVGHVYRRYRFDKRTYRNQNLGPFVNHEMNRCIQCYRCVRFYRDYAGGRDIDVFGAHDHVYFGRFEDGVLESPFSGNLVEVCPTGVFTDKTFREHYARKWDLTTAPSVCALCGHGCNIIPGERYGTLRRIRNRFNSAVNGYFICDRGRYGYEFVNSDFRVRTPLLCEDGEQRVATVDEALASTRGLLTGAVAGIGSPRASLEANAALRALVGAEHFSHGMPAAQFDILTALADLLRHAPAHHPTLYEMEEADVVLILGEDLEATAPRLALAARQAIREVPDEHAVAQMGVYPFDDYGLREAEQGAKEPFFVFNTARTSFDNDAAAMYRAVPDELARMVYAIVHDLDATVQRVPGLPDDTRALARRIAGALKEAKRPLIITGASVGSLALVQAAAALIGVLATAGITPMLRVVMPSPNCMGLALLGGKNLEAIDADTLVVLDSDRLPEALLAGKRVIAIDSLLSENGARANVVLPAATFAEETGTFVSSESRMQRYYQVFTPNSDVRASWRWIAELLPDGNPWANLDALHAAIAADLPQFAPITDIAPPADFRVDGQKVPRQSHRFSGRTVINADQSVLEPTPPTDADSPFTFSMEGFQGKPPAPLTPRFWTPGWNSVQAVNKFQDEVGGPLHGGEPGRRLLASDYAGLPAAAIPSAFTHEMGTWLVLPAYHLFGSEPLSLLSPGIAQLAPAPYLALHPDDTADAGIAHGDNVTLSVEGYRLTLPAVLREDVPRGAALLPAGVVDLPVALPARGTLEGGPHA